MNNFYKNLKDLEDNVDLVEVVLSVAKNADKQGKHDVEMLFLLLSMIVLNENAIKDAIASLEPIGIALMLSALLHNVINDKTPATKLEEMIYQVFPAERAMELNNLLLESYPNIFKK